jgi:replicative DNA helicase
MSFPVLVAEADEKAVIGCVLAGCDWQHVGMLRPDEFGAPAHVLIWEAFRRLRQKGRPVDTITASEELKAMGRLAEVGGSAYLMSLDQLPVVGHVAGYVSAVRSIAVKREVQRRANMLAAAAHDPHLTDADLLARAQSGFMGLSAGEVDEAGDADVWNIMDRWQAWMDGDGKALAYVPHTISGLAPTFGPDGQEESVSPGYPMSLSVVGGMSGVGKTSVAASEIEGFVFRLGLPGGIIGLEDGTEWLAKRLMARELRIRFGLVGACRLNDWQQVKLADWCERVPPVLRERVRTWPKGMDSPQLLAKVEQWKQWGARWVWVDHGLRVKYRAGARDRLDLLINETTEALAEIARPTRNHPGMAIIVNWHVNREWEEETAPQRKHFKESGYLDANARYMVAVWKREKSPGARLFTGVKANFGPEGWTVEVPLDADAGLLRSTGGRVLDFEAERRAEADAKQAAAKVRRGGLFGGNAA